MAKKTLSIVLAVVMLMSVLVVGSFASESYETKVNKLILGNGIVNDLDSTSENLDYYLAKDPNIITENLSFWDDEIIDAYNNAKTEADWEALFKMMGDEEDDSCWVDSYDGPLTMWYPKHLCNGKAQTDVVYTTDKAYAKPGEEITVTISVSTNFYSMNQMVGLIFDKTLMDYVNASYIEVPGRANMGTVANYGIVSGADKRAYIWPASMRDNANGEYDQYQFVKVGISYDSSYSGYKYAFKYDNEPIATVTLKVKDNVPDGTALNFFAVDGINPLISELELHDEYGQNMTLFSSTRTLCDSVSKGPLEPADYDHTYTFQNAVVYVGDEAPAYEVKSAEQEGTASIGGKATVKVTAEGKPDAIRLTASASDFSTFLREDASIVANNDGTETWTVEVFADSASKEYTATAKYGDTWTESGETFTILASDGQDLNVYSIFVYDMDFPEGNGGVVTHGKHKMEVVTGKDVYKLQFVEGSIKDGCTSTYCPVKGEALHMADVVEKDGKLVWTFDYSFSVFNAISRPIRTRAITTTFSTVDNVTLDAYVIY